MSIKPEFIDAKVAWSIKKFGKDQTTHEVCNHIRKELIEAENNPTDATEWADIILLAFDGAGRNNISGAALIDAIYKKQYINQNREWSDEDYKDNVTDDSWSEIKTFYKKYIEDVAGVDNNPMIVELTKETRYEIITDALKVAAGYAKNDMSPEEFYTMCLSIAEAKHKHA